MKNKTYLLGVILLAIVIAIFLIIKNGQTSNTPHKIVQSMSDTKQEVAIRSAFQHALRSTMLQESQKKELKTLFPS